MGAQQPELTFTASLAAEHQDVLVVVAAMEREIAWIRGGGAVHADDVARMVEFTREFTDGRHHDKEEKVLFPRLSQPYVGGQAPVSVMLAEHDHGRACVRAVVENLPAATDGDMTAAAKVADGLEGYATLLRAHIVKEDTVLYPLAERALDEADKAVVAAEFERIDREDAASGVREKYHAMARELGSRGT